MIFVDRSVPKGVAEQIKKVRSDVIWLEDKFRHDTPGEEWLPVAGQEGWLVVLRDKKVRTRPGEREKIMRHRVGCFILNQKQDPTRWQYLQLLAGTLDQMQEEFIKTPRPFMYTIDRNGAFRRVA